jgi:PTS system mannose-specific IIC component
LENITIGLVGSLLVLDTTVAFQFLISQPLIACTVLGWFLGDIRLGLEVGFYIQLIWLSSMPVGAAIIPEGNVASIVVTALVLRYIPVYDLYYTVILLAIIYGILVSYLGGQLTVLYRKSNMFLLRKMLGSAREGNLAGLSGINFVALLFHYSLMLILIIVTLIIGDILFSFVRYIPVQWEMYFHYGIAGILGVGAGMVVPLFKERSFRAFLAAGVLIGVGFFFLI